MSIDAIGRVPVADWLMGLAVLACGVAAVIAVLRYCDQQRGDFRTASDDGTDEDGGSKEGEAPLALPPGQSHRAIIPDEIDEELWRMIDAERPRRPAESMQGSVERIAARALEPGTDTPQSPAPLRHFGKRYRRQRADGPPGYGEWF